MSRHVAHGADTCRHNSGRSGYTPIRRGRSSAFGQAENSCLAEGRRRLGVVNPRIEIHAFFPSLEPQAAGRRRGRFGLGRSVFCPGPGCSGPATAARRRAAVASRRRARAAPAPSSSRSRRSARRAAWSGAESRRGGPRRSTRASAAAAAARRTRWARIDAPCRPRGGSASAPAAGWSRWPSAGAARRTRRRFAPASAVSRPRPAACAHGPDRSLIGLTQAFPVRGSVIRLSPGCCAAIDSVAIVQSRSAVA